MATQKTRQGVGQRPARVQAKIGRRKKRQRSEEQIARGLGWFSVGIGLAEFFAPKKIAGMIGMKNHHALLRAFGLREITSGLGIFSKQRPAGWVWSRVAGDFLDLAALGGAMTSGRSRRGRLAVATAAVAGVTTLDIYTARRLSSATGRPATGETVLITRTININRPIDEVYRFYRDFENLPRFMENLEAVRITGDRRSHWIARAPGEARVEWDAEIVNDIPNELITWRSLAGADIENAGSVQFVSLPAGRGTRVIVELQYKPPAGIVGSTIAKIFGKEPGQQVHEDLRKLKQVLEAGEIATTEGQPSGRRGRIQLWK